MDISFLLIIIGILGLLILFWLKSWQLKTGRDFTSRASSSFERVAKASAKTASVKVKESAGRIKERAINREGQPNLKSMISNNRMADLIKGKRAINRNNGSSSEFLNHMSDVKKESREETAGEEENKN